MSQAGSTSSGGGGGGSLNTLTPDVGGVVSPVSGNIDIHGTGGIITSNTGAGSLTINFSGSGGLLQNSMITLTSTQIKNLLTVPVTIIPAQGPGTIIITYAISFKLDYGGTSPFTDPTTFAQANISYFDGTNTFPITSGAITDQLITQSQTTYFAGLPIFPGQHTIPADIENLPIVIDNLGGSGNWAGNAEDNNTLVVSTQYLVLTL